MRNAGLLCSHNNVSYATRHQAKLGEARAQVYKACLGVARARAPSHIPVP